jgi:N6-L-threonylcarbamoyladenine synthase
MRPVLGLESSCDETAAAVLAPDGTHPGRGVLSQEPEHAPFGGVVPEIAARAHLAHLPGLVRKRVLDQPGLGFADLGAVAATSGPGLIGGLIVGACFGKGIAIAHGLPFVAVNHLEAHALTARLPGCCPKARRRFPYLLLLVSGGHCQCVAVEGVGRYRRLGTTLDDAVGEAFDKAAKLLGLPWPGGPHLERLAAGGDPRAVPCRGRCSAGRAATSPSAGSRPRSRRRWRKGASAADIAAASRPRSPRCWPTARAMRWRCCRGRPRWSSPAASRRTRRCARRWRASRRPRACRCSPRRCGSAPTTR